MLLLNLYLIPLNYLFLSILIIDLCLIKFFAHRNLIGICEIWVRLMKVGLLVRRWHHSLTRHIRRRGYLHRSKLWMRDGRSYRIERRAWFRLSKPSINRFIWWLVWVIWIRASLIAISIHQLNNLNYFYNDNLYIKS